ncbi:hypothetical protein [Thiobacillus sedimenti]|uniref:Uncharacterized protein n=1 Tax=Thiobacillus sedimenti TaxID=3110231 RepID=A0ABZ1CMB2_9PROT|nr:hypothetical protein [Thiobacillus sp. SCUT-2]WRS40532.1 hypothetical protein VA613_06555 [Thiobacillus sp. SCUT-2]
MKKASIRWPILRCTNPARALCRRDGRSGAAIVSLQPCDGGRLGPRRVDPHEKVAIAVDEFG